MNYKNLMGIAIAIILVCFQPAFAQTSGNKLIMVEQYKIWDKAEYNAFTDLIYFKGYWYCAFREGNTHVARDGSDNGKLRVIRSKDGEKWKSVALMLWPQGDVRDAKLSITAKDELMLNGAVSFYPLTRGEPQISVTWLSKNGTRWSNAYKCKTGVSTWRWSATWHEGVGYSIGYGGKDAEGCLYHTLDGKKWEILKNNFFPNPDSRPNETSLVFTENGTSYCLLRQDGGTCTAMLGSSKPPYTKWEWKDLGIRIGGPKFIQLEDGRFVAAVRLFSGTPDKPDWDTERTSVCILDVEKATLTEVLKLPSGGDCSYAGMVEKDGLIWISYYSSHEGKPSIYLAKVKV